MTPVTSCPSPFLLAPIHSPSRALVGVLRRSASAAFVVSSTRLSSGTLNVNRNTDYGRQDDDKEEEDEKEEDSGVSKDMYSGRGILNGDPKTLKKALWPSSRSNQRTNGSLVLRKSDYVNKPSKITELGKFSNSNGRVDPSDKEEIHLTGLSRNSGRHAGRKLVDADEEKDMFSGRGILNGDPKTLKKALWPSSRSNQSTNGSLVLRKSDYLNKSSKITERGKFSNSNGHVDPSDKEEIHLTGLSGNSGRHAERKLVDADEEKLVNTALDKERLRERGFDVNWFPLIEYLSTLGMEESDFIKIFDTRMSTLEYDVPRAKTKVNFFLSVGIKRSRLRKMITRQPRILRYSVNRNFKPRVSFLRTIGIPESDIGRIISTYPDIFTKSIEHTIKPNVRYLVEEVGIKASDLCKVVRSSPQVLLMPLVNSWTQRFFFLGRELGAPREKIVKMVRRHPQLLHYSIQNTFKPKIDFFRSVGMSDSDLLEVLTCLPQVLSLSLEDNIKPKFMYLVHELGNEVHSLKRNSFYLSLSLDKRIRPRHRFLLSLKKAPKGRFPLHLFMPSDETFCKKVARTSLDRYLAFKRTLLNKDLRKRSRRK